MSVGLAPVEQGHVMACGKSALDYVPPDQDSASEDQQFHEGILLLSVIVEQSVRFPVNEVEHIIT